MESEIHETVPGLSPMDRAERLFQLVACEPYGLVIDGRLAPDLPQRPVPLTELRRLLNGRAVSSTTRDAVWRELAARARSLGQMWVIGAVGVALPELRDITGRIASGYRAGDPDGIALIGGEALVAFIDAVRTVDLHAPDVATRLYGLARRAGERARRVAESEPDRPFPVTVSVPPRHLDVVLFDATEKTVEPDPELTGAAPPLCDATTTSARSRNSSDIESEFHHPKGGRGTTSGSARISTADPLPSRTPASRLTPSGTAKPSGARYRGRQQAMPPKSAGPETTAPGPLSTEAAIPNFRGRAAAGAAALRNGTECPPAGALESPSSTSARPESTGAPAATEAVGTPAGAAATGSHWADRRQRSRRTVNSWRRNGSFLLVAVLVGAVLVMAETDVFAVTGTRAGPPTAPDQLGRVFDNLRNWLISLLAALATLMLTIGGLRYLIAGGDPGEVQKAKAAFKAAAFGYALAVLAPLFVNVLKRVVGG
ncbi:hypothetical protein ACQP1V_03800 [Microtetraspora malaysiensis]|uniref:hypothetical protein n=1 Tax=Microtetraspora malaysiensis TaxID=161358 RepID=UPI003D8E43A8